MSDCILWTGYRDKNGYGRLCRRGRTYWAHRWAYEQNVGPIPEGTEIDHTCRVKLCINPDHLEAVTHAENVRRALAVNSAFDPATHCRAGHEYTPANTYQRRGGNGRACRACHAAAARAYRARNRDAA